MTRSSAPAHILCVVGARPNFMKIAPIMRALAAAPAFRATLVHTGQHYDAAMKHAFFDQLHIPEPDVDLGVGSGSHSEQTAQIMLRFEPVVDERQPDALLVVGDVNSTLACALVAVKKQIPVIHVEAGLRSGDRTMPEEINRLLTDQLSDLLFTTEASAADNLAREGIAPEKVVFAGNVMIDTLSYNLAAAQRRGPLPSKASTGSPGSADYGLLTLHRPANVDDPVTLKPLLETLVEVSRETPLVFPVHPRTRARIDAAGLDELLAAGRFALLPPQGYLEMLGLMRDAEACAHGLRWHPGGDHRARRALRDAAGQHGAADHRRARVPTPSWAAIARDPTPPSMPSVRAGARPAASRRSGTGTLRSALPRRWPIGTAWRGLHDAA